MFLKSRRRRVRKDAVFSGFTLIELLVVISIISLLSSVVFASVNNARRKAVSARAVAELKQAALALELYYDKYGIYPSANSYGEQSSWCVWDISTQDQNSNGIPFMDFLATEGLMSQTPSTPGMGVSYNYSGGSCGCSSGAYELVAYGLPASIPGVTDNDVCDNPAVWSPACSAEIGPTRYCIIGR